jgi:shikimate kinase
VTAVLTGFMGTGKTRVGERLAAQLGCPFVDTDTLIERAAGRPIRDIFAAEGEAYFRRLEKRAIAQALAVPRAVVATGGGAVLDPANRARLRAAGPLVCLAAGPAVILSRTRRSGARPLLHGPDRRRRIERLLAERAPAYADADLLIDTSTRSVDAVVADIVAFLRSRPRGRQAPV